MPVRIARRGQRTSVRWRPPEFTAIAAAAMRRGQTVSEFTRDATLRAAASELNASTVNAELVRRAS